MAVVGGVTEVGEVEVTVVAVAVEEGGEGVVEEGGEGRERERKRERERERERLTRFLVDLACLMSLSLSLSPSLSLSLARLFLLYVAVYSFERNPCMGWLRLVGSLKLQVSSAKEPYKRDDILQKRRVI